MKLNVILMMAGAVAAVAGCSKYRGKPAKIFPIELKAVALESRGSVRLYTKSGEITDEGVIAEFINSEEGFNASFAPRPDDFMTFITDSTAQFGISAVLYRVSREGNTAVVFRSPFILGPYARGEEPQKILDTYRLSKHNDPLQMFHSGGQISYKGEVVTYCSGTDRSFLFPVMIYKLSRRSGNSGQASIRVASGKLFNEFNKDFLATLGDRDTIAYQQSYVRYSK